MGLQVCFPFVASLLPLGQCLGAARGRQEEESGAAPVLRGEDEISEMEL